MPNAKLGAKVDRYFFFVRLLPPLLHTGLARRTNIAITLKTVSGHGPTPGHALINVPWNADDPVEFPFEFGGGGWTRTSSPIANKGSTFRINRDYLSKS
jgi:hypothetical protein